VRKNIGNSPGKPQWDKLEELPMHDWTSLSHVRWDCKYHIVFVPKYRQKRLYGKFRTRVGEIIRDLCRQRGVEFLEGHLMPDHIHMCLRVPPKFSIAFVIGFIKGKSAVLIHRKVLKRNKVAGFHFWARGYCVSTVGLDEQTIRTYIREQERYEKQQLEFDFE
jgi:putative transposase